MSDPRVLIIRLLEACNAGCFMCGFARSVDPYRFTLDDMEALLSQLQGSAIRTLRFTGGEPLLVTDLPEMIRAIGRTGRSISIITNGWYLKERLPQLAAAGLTQVIGSLDGASAETHDRFRRLPGLFERLRDGLTTAADAPIRTRANTVVGPHNLEELPALWDLLCHLGVEQWSLIPLKRDDQRWNHWPLERQEEAVARLRETVANSRRRAERGPRFVGPGLDMLGRDAAERNRLWEEGRNMTPRSRCGLVDEVRYYAPKEGVVFSCNCTPHRAAGRPLWEELGADSFTGRGLPEVRRWLSEHGPSQCTGCEPANVALAEGMLDLDEDPLAF